MTWTPDQLSRLDRAQELRIAGRRDDGSLRPLVIIWAVVVDDDLYLRSVRGADGAWYKGVQQHHEGRIESGGVAADVRFADVPGGDPVQDRIDAAYAAKYRSYRSAVESITAKAAVATTLRVIPD
ncbi:MAG: DUF2255 family protein [Amnibacterium sp.]